MQEEAEEVVDQRYAEVLHLVELDLADSPFAGIPWPIADQADLDALAREIDRPVPDQLVRWLTICNGSMAGPGGLYGAYATPDRDQGALDIITYMLMYADKRWPQQGWIPVAGDGCGNRYVIDASGRLLDGTGVFFVDTSDDPGVPAYGVASDLPTFLAQLLLHQIARTPWPFDPTYIAQHDPMLTIVCPDPLLPWSPP